MWFWTWYKRFVTFMASTLMLMDVCVLLIILLSLKIPTNVLWHLDGDVHTHMKYEQSSSINVVHVILYIDSRYDPSDHIMSTRWWCMRFDGTNDFALQMWNQPDDWITHTHTHKHTRDTRTRTVEHTERKRTTTNGPIGAYPANPSAVTRCDGVRSIK